jgi:hypothetical protein
MHLDRKENIDFYLMTYQYVKEDIKKLKGNKILSIFVSRNKKISWGTFSSMSKNEFFEYEDEVSFKLDLELEKFLTFSRSYNIDQIIFDDDDDNINEPNFIKESDNIKYLRFEKHLEEVSKKFENGKNQFNQKNKYLSKLSPNDPVYYNRDKAVVATINKKEMTMGLYSHKQSSIIKGVPFDDISPRKKVERKKEEHLNPYLRTLSTEELLMERNALYGRGGEYYKKGELQYSIEDVYDVLNTREHVSYKGKNKNGSRRGWYY